MIYRYSENGLESVMLFEKDDGVRIGIAHPDGAFTCPLSKTAARALAKRIVELVGDEPQSKPKIKTVKKRQMVFFLSGGERLSVIGEYGSCIPDANMGECRINDIEGDTLLVKCSEVIAIQDRPYPIEEDQEDKV